VSEAGIHTCSAECPCQTGGEPTPDFLPVEGASVWMMLSLGIPASEVAEAVMDARRRGES
jgi:hypothetical protein